MFHQIARYVFEGTWEDTVGSHLLFGKDQWEGGTVSCRGTANKKIRFVRVLLEEKAAQPAEGQASVVLAQPLNVLEPHDPGDPGEAAPGGESGAVGVPRTGA